MANDDLKKSYTQPAGAAAGAVNLSAPDLTRHPPRSPRTRLGGFCHLPRLLDKGRAVAHGTAGEFHYNCPMDQRFFAFTGIAHEAFMAEIKSGKSDSELLAYVLANMAPKRPLSEIKAWSVWFENEAPNNPDSRGFFNDVHRKNAPQRTDIESWFDWLELDDYITYGGKA